jgi:hypothetical protein
MHIKNITFLFMLAVSASLTSCIKQIDKNFRGATVVEFDATVLNPVTAPFTYPVILRVPPFGLPVTTANSPTIINRAITVPVRLRVNLVGPHRDNDEVINYRVLDDVTPSTNNLLGVAGTHFNTGTSFTIPAKSSFGEVVITVLNPGSASATPREVHLELLGNTNIKPSENYKRVAIRITQN